MKKINTCVMVIILVLLVYINSGCKVENQLTSATRSSSQIEMKASQIMRDTYDNDSIIINESGGSYFSEYALYDSITNRIEGEIGGYYGALRLWKLFAKDEGKIIVSNKCNFYGGKFKLVLCTPDNNVKTILEFTEKGEPQKETISIDVGTGEYKVMMVGYNADVDLDILLDLDEAIVIED